MIFLTKLNNTPFVLNASIIETIEETPDTVITTTNGKIYIVIESAAEVVGKTIDFYKKVYSQMPKIIK